MKRVIVLGVILAALIILARLEGSALHASAPIILNSSPLATAALIFAHNSLAATVVAAGMSFYAALMDSLPERLRRGEALVRRRAEPISAALALLIVLNSLRSAGGLSALSLEAASFLLPVAAVETYGLYLAALFPLKGRATAANLAKVYAVFLVGAILEAALIAISIHLY